MRKEKNELLQSIETLKREKKESEIKVEILRKRREIFIAFFENINKENRKEHLFTTYWPDFKDEYYNILESI